jgi:hypothetical protein
LADNAIWENNIVAFRADGFNFNKFKSEELQEKLAVANWEPSQDLPDVRREPRKPVS